MKTLRLAAVVAFPLISHVALAGGASVVGVLQAPGGLTQAVAVGKATVNVAPGGAVTTRQFGSTNALGSIQAGKTNSLNATQTGRNNSAASDCRSRLPHKRARHRLANKSAGRRGGGFSIGGGSRAIGLGICG